MGTGILELDAERRDLSAHTAAFARALRFVLEQDWPYTEPALEALRAEDGEAYEIVLDFAPIKDF